MSEKSELRIKEIVEAAINEFVEKGYEEASMEGIARRAGISKGGLYHHFSSKLEILFAVNMRFLEPIQQFMDRIETDSIPEGLNRFTEDYLNYWNRHRKELNLYFLIMNASFNDMKIMKLLKDSASANFAYFENLFAEGRDRGKFIHIDCRSHAVAFISCLDGYLGYLLIEPAVSLTEISEAIKKVFIQSILK